MKLWFYPGLGLAALWLQLTAAPYLAAFGLKPNLPLLALILVGLRWVEPWLFLFGASLGLALDVFSHGVAGIYGISFFLTSLLTRLVGLSIYENNVIFTIAAVGVLTLAEGLIAVSIFEILDGGTPWWDWILTRVLPLALYHALLTPLLFYLLLRLEKLLKLADALEARR